MGRFLATRIKMISSVSLRTYTGKHVTSLLLGSWQLLGQYLTGLWIRNFLTLSVRL